MCRHVRSRYCIPCTVLAVSSTFTRRRCSRRVRLLHSPLLSACQLPQAALPRCRDVKINIFVRAAGDGQRGSEGSSIPHLVHPSKYSSSR